MADRQRRGWTDSGLIDALRRIEPEIAWPTAAVTGSSRDVAAAVRARLESMPSAGTVREGPARRRWLRSPGWIARPLPRALLIAVVALIALAALAGAAGLGLPGLRIFLGGGPASPPPSVEPSRSPTPGAPGSDMRLGEPASLADREALDAQVGFHVRWPADPRAGQPDAVYVDESKRGQVSLAWAARSDRPPTLEPGVGLLMTEFLGAVDEGFYGKVVGSGTTVEPVLVNGERGYWLSGDPHYFFYAGPGGVVQDERRWVGDALIWSDGRVTYRLESALGRDETIRVAESVR
jgi:hypothetical protein